MAREEDGRAMTHEAEPCRAWMRPGTTRNTTRHPGGQLRSVSMTGTVMGAENQEQERSRRDDDDPGERDSSMVRGRRQKHQAAVRFQGRGRQAHSSLRKFPERRAV